jgi:hypothetical protein
MFDLEVLKQNAVSRRAFLTRMSAAGLGAAAIALLEGCGGGDNNSSPGPGTGGVSATVRSAFPGVPGNTDNQVVLNYAYSLEILEAYLYLVGLNVAAGLAPLTPLLPVLPTASNPTGSYSLVAQPGSIAANLVTPAFIYLVQFAYAEAAHRDFLQTALGSAAAPVVPASGRYKFGTPDGSPGTTLSSILSALLPLEETGTRAYLGAAPYLTDNNTLQVAASIYSTECRHSASVEYILGLDPGPNRGIAGVPQPEQEVATGVAANVFEKFLAPSVVLNAVATGLFV